MTEDPRISEIRAVLDAYYDAKTDSSEAVILARVTRILDRPAPDHDRLPAEIEHRIDEIVVGVKAAAKAAHALATVVSKSGRSDMAGWLAEVAIAINTGREWPTLAPLPAPRVFFPGDTVPAGREVANRNGDVYRWDRDREILPYEGPLIEVQKLSPEEWQAAADRARAEREAKQDG